MTFPSERWSIEKRDPCTQDKSKRGRKNQHKYFLIVIKAYVKSGFRSCLVCIIPLKLCYRYLKQILLNDSLHSSAFTLGFASESFSGTIVSLNCTTDGSMTQFSTTTGEILRQKSSTIAPLEISINFWHNTRWNYGTFPHESLFDANTDAFHIFWIAILWKLKFQTKLSATHARSLQTCCLFIMLLESEF